MTTQTKSANTKTRSIPIRLGGQRVSFTRSEELSAFIENEKLIGAKHVPKAKKEKVDAH